VLEGFGIKPVERVPLAEALAQRAQGSKDPKAHKARPQQSRGFVFHASTTIIVAPPEAKFPTSAPVACPS
jgi:hypothetical protein